MNKWYKFSQKETTGIIVLLVLIYNAIIMPRLYCEIKDNNLNNNTISINTISENKNHIEKNTYNSINNISFKKSKVKSRTQNITNKKTKTNLQSKNKKTSPKKSIKKFKYKSTSRYSSTYSNTKSKKTNPIYSNKNITRKYIRKQKTRIELNSSDTTELKKVYGIGSWYSRKIVRYRERLGGFYSVTQLKEIKMREGTYERISPQLIVDTTYIKKINLDTIGFKNLLRHPYFDYEMVKKVFNLRKKDSHITSKDLLENKIVTLNQYRKIQRYIVRNINL